MRLIFDFEIYDEGVVELGSIGLSPDPDNHAYWRTDHKEWNVKKVEQIVDCLYAHLVGMESSDYKDLDVDMHYNTEEGHIVVPLVADEPKGGA